MVVVDARKPPRLRRTTPTAAMMVAVVPVFLWIRTIVHVRTCVGFVGRYYFILTLHMNVKLPQYYVCGALPWILCILALADAFRPKKRVRRNRKKCVSSLEYPMMEVDYGDDDYMGVC